MFECRAAADLRTYTNRVIMKFKWWDGTLRTLLSLNKYWVFFNHFMDPGLVDFDPQNLNPTNVQAVVGFNVLRAHAIKIPAEKRLNK